MSQQPPDAFAALECGVRGALESYSNVHRGSGHHSLVTTRLYERARQVVLRHLGRADGAHTVVFATPRRAEALLARMPSAACVSSRDIGLPLGVHAVAAKHRELPRGVPWETGGGTARLVSPDWVVWARSPGRFEPGTPAIVNVIAFAVALEWTSRMGRDAFSRAVATAPGDLRADAFPGLAGRVLLDALRGTLVGRGRRVPTSEGAQPYVNLDNAASTPTFEPIWETACRTWRQPAAMHQRIVEDTRSACAEVLGAPLATHEVFFTSNTTEAINLVAESLRRESRPDAEAVVVNTLLEHNSNELPWRGIAGRTPIRMSVDTEGFLDAATLEEALRACERPGAVRLVAVSGASNVLGACNDLAEICRVAHRHGALVLVDAAQLVAHRRIDMEAWGVDFLAFSAHKTYAPFGSGVLMAKKGLLALDPGEKERIRASGEENAVGIACLGTALRLLQRIGFDVIQEEEAALTARALRGLARVPGLTVYGTTDPEAPRFGRRGGVIAFSLARTMPHGVARALAEEGGIGVRSGCHCAHMLIKHMLRVPPWAQRLQQAIVTLFPKFELPGVVRASFGLQTSAGDVDALVRVLERIAARTQRTRAATAEGEPRRLPRKLVRAQMEAFAAAAETEVYGPTQ